MSNLHSSSTFISHLAQICIFSKQLSSTASREPIKQWCRAGVGFLAFFGNVAQKMYTALSISHRLLSMGSSVMFLKDMTDPDGFLACFGNFDKKIHTALSIFAENHVGCVTTKTTFFPKSE